MSNLAVKQSTLRSPSLLWDLSHGNVASVKKPCARLVVVHLLAEPTITSHAVTTCNMVLCGVRLMEPPSWHFLQVPTRQATVAYLSWQPSGTGQLAFWRTTDAAAGAAALSVTTVADTAAAVRLLQLQLQYLTFMRDSDAIEAFKARQPEGPRLLLQV